MSSSPDSPRPKTHCDPIGAPLQHSVGDHPGPGRVEYTIAGPPTDAARRLHYTHTVSSSSMRASHLQANLRMLSKLSREQEARVRADASETVRAIEGSARTAWLPLSLDVALNNAVYDVAGPRGLRNWSREAIMESARGPLLGPIRRGLLRLGITPQSSLKRAPLAWKLMYRDCGEIRYTGSGSHAAELALVDPPDLLLTESYLLTIEGALDAAIALGGGRGAALRLCNTTPPAFRCEWAPRRSWPKRARSSGSVPPPA